MASWMNNLRNLGRQAPPRSNSGQPPNRSNTGSPSSYSPNSLAPPYLPAAPASPSLTATTTIGDVPQQQLPPAGKIPLFFRDEYATFMVKGNFMTLAAKPMLVEEGEWLAHQVVEQERLMSAMIAIVQEPDRSTGKPICNEHSCPTMSAGPTATYQWMDTKRNPINLPAAQYIRNIQTWVKGKITDEEIFPTIGFQTAPPLPNPQQTATDPNHWLGKTSGFSPKFESEIKNMYKQMFRCYAHLYWAHWLAFWEMDATRNLNTCFIHFVNVGRSYGLLTDRDTEPMQPLIDLWVRRGDIPSVASDVTAAPATAGAAAPAAATTARPASATGSAPTSATTPTARTSGGAAPAAGAAAAAAPAAVSSATPTNAPSAPPA